MARMLPSRWTRYIVWGLTAALFAVPISGRAAEEGPFLRIETGVHEATINGAAVIPGQDRLVTVSDDKTARVWSRGTLLPQGVIRPPLGSSDTGALYAVAASAKTIAVGGRLKNPANGRYGVALYSTHDLAPAGILWGFTAPVTALALSPSGRLLAVGMQGGAGTRVIDLISGRSAPADGSYAGTVNGLAFDSGDRLAAVSDAGELHLSGPDGQPIKVPPGPKGTRFWRRAFSPDGNHLAIGDRDNPLVHLFDSQKLRWEADLRGGPLTAGGLGTVAYGADGKTVFAAGDYVDKSGQVFVRRFVLGPTPSATDLRATRQLVTDLIPDADGLTITTADPAILRIDAKGQPATTILSNHSDFRAAGVEALLVSDDATVIDIPGADGKRIRFDVRAHGILVGDATKMHRFYAASKGLSVTDWQNSRATRVNGQAVALEPSERIRSVAVLPDGSAAALGSDFFIRMIGRSGEIWAPREMEAPVWALNVGNDGRLLVAALGDGSVHWLDAASGKELLSLLIDPATRRFVLWTPEGFFDHDQRTDGMPDGRGLIGYRMNSASGRDSTFIEIGQLYPLFFRPDLVGLSLRNDAAAARELNQEAKLLGTVAVALAGGVPAKATLIEACALKNNACAETVRFEPHKPPKADEVVLHTDHERVRMRFRLDDAAGPPGPVAIKRNEAVIAGKIDIKVTEAKYRIEEVVLPLVHGVNRVRISPFSANRAVETAPEAEVAFVVERTQAAEPVTRSAGGPATPNDVARPEQPISRTLYLLSVGVGNFNEPAVNLLALPNAANDAETVAGLFADPSPPIYQKAIPTKLIDTDATRDAVLGAVRDIASKAGADDIVLIFLAGHGMRIEGQYYFATSDLGTGDPKAVRAFSHPSSPEAGAEATAALFKRHGLGQAELLDLVQSIEADHVALILDTCYSATAATSDAVARRDINATVTKRLGHAAGRFVLSSAFSKALDAAKEGSDHGLFTSFMLRAFDGEADFEGRRRIDFPNLAKYVQENVRGRSLELATKWHDDALRQEPAFYFAGSDFFPLRSVGGIGRKRQ